VSLQTGGPLTVPNDPRLQQFSMPFSERHKLEFRAEFFNLLNRVNLGNANTARQYTVRPHSSWRPR